MKDTRLIYESLLNEHRRLSNEISDIKAQSFELNETEQKKIKELQLRQLQVMNQMKAIFNGNNR